MNGRRPPPSYNTVIPADEAEACPVPTPFDGGQVKVERLPSRSVTVSLLAADEKVIGVRATRCFRGRARRS